MMMMQISYSLDLMALTMGTALLVWSMKSPGKGSWLAKLIGIIVMALAIISILCMYACALRGECHKPMPMMGDEAGMMAPAAGGSGPGEQPMHDHKKMMEHKHPG